MSLHICIHFYCMYYSNTIHLSITTNIHISCNGQHTRRPQAGKKIFFGLFGEGESTT